MNKRTKDTVLGLAAVFFAALLGAWVAGLVQSGVNHALTLDYLKVLIVWPVAAVIITLVIVLIFRTQVGRFIDRINEASAMGATLKAASSQTNVSATQGPPRDLPREAVEDINRYIGNYHNEQPVVLAQRLLGALREARLWEFRYLAGAGLAKSTMGILGILGQHDGAMSPEAWAAVLAPFPDVERAAIEAAAENSLLILKSPDGSVRITEKGAEFLRFCGLPVKPQHLDQGQARPLVQ